jgi:acetolactate synthase small subunit
MVYCCEHGALSGLSDLFANRGFEIRGVLVDIVLPFDVLVRTGFF